ncbi:YciI family protein [Paradesertivirga mongoliensis]|uniref:YciI family protein n=1 Tax=Paradesertivirga mongoliensis TaxID=2100740 RepID=A0ABW4ZRR3_9SPHI|nr:YciI family protein [Pedobacter mongoliensis]
MNQYLISALDFTDENALQRRLHARPMHFETVRKLKASGNFIIGGAILNDRKQMIGSSLIVQFETDRQLSAWLAEEPYLLLKVWEKVDIKPFKVADV